MVPTIPSAEQSRAFVTAFFATTATLIVIVALLNFTVGSSVFFDRKKAYERGIAALLAQGKNVTGVENFDDRALQRARAVLQGGQNVEWIVIGSSRSVQISQEMLNTHRLLNLSVAGASIEDYVALLELSTRFAPRSVIIGVDPWIFNRNNAQDRWQSLRDVYAQGLTRLTAGTDDAQESLGKASESEISSFVEHALLLVDHQQTVSTLRRLMRILTANAAQYRPKTDDSPEETVDVLRVDGSRVYNRKFSQVPHEEISRMAISYSRPPVYSLEGFDRLDERTVRLFNLMLDYLKGRANVYIFLPPYHPTTYRLIGPRYPRIEEAEYLLRAIAAARRLVILGSYDPAAAGCSEAEFLDGMHANATCIGRVMAPLRAKTGE